jgi:uncharacterized oligopeptide transporter (OPT) family protein
MSADNLPVPQHRLTLRSFIAGTIFAILLCAINSYLTLRFGIIEEGPMIAALFFYSILYFITIFALSISKIIHKISKAVSIIRPITITIAPITTAEMVIVATMGSAGGSLGFIANFFAAKAMTSKPFTVLEMFLFAAVSGIIGILSVIILRHLLIIKDQEQPEDRQLPWVGAKVVKGIIDPLVSHGDPRQPRYLAFFTVIAALYVIFNTSGVGWVPEEGLIPIFGLSAYGAGIAFAPFTIGSGYIMGLRTCFGFFVGGIALLFMAPHLPADIQSKPQLFLWPGVMFLVTSGITALAIRWRVIAEAIKSLFRLQSGVSSDNDPIMSKRISIIITIFGIITSVFILHLLFKLTLIIIFAMIIIGGLILNLIATRAYAQTYFNPVRVMGVLLQGVCATLGGSSVSTNLTGAGFIAGSGTQCSNLTSDMVYGRDYKIPSRWQFWTQSITLLSCAIISALTFYLIHSNTPLTFDSKVLNAPAAKMWAIIGLLFDPSSRQELPPFAVESMWIASAVGVVWTILESKDKIRRFLPCSIGLGLGLVLHPFIDFSFFAGGVLMWIVLGRFLKVSKVTLSTIAVACIVGEGIGGLLQGILKALNVIGVNTGG